MAEDRMTRRQFVRDTAAGAAALAAGVSVPGVVRVGNAEETDTQGILNYSPDMEYRRCGKTGVIGLGGNIPATQQPGEPFGFAPGGDVHNARASLFRVGHDLLHDAYRERISFLR